ncbi:ChaN family lipoprotein [Solidesulfovibrio fructosivorans]|uniref:ChaN family lipoprotein n=1 Tax=Solidesulfovibrio fructosivorans TaxID=878 RepID=UPI0002F60B3E|nr:ChaN family lipoprotein [Solidesulfovibrio fructosivorans]
MKGFPLSHLPVFFLFSSLLLAGCAGKNVPVPMAPGHVAPETLVGALGAPLSPREFTATFLSADYILAGEEHPNPCDHLAQAELIRRLVAAGVRPAIGLEMLPVETQPVLDAFSAGKLAVADLPRALDWKKTWGYDFALYEPIFAAARQYRLPVFALNAPRGLARKVGQKGLDNLTPSERAALPGTIVPPDPAQVQELRAVYDEHAARLEKMIKAGKKKTDGRDRFADFITVQSLWDTQMASRALYAHAASKRPVVIIAGGGHVERGWGIARRLAELDPGATIATVMPWRGGEKPEADLAQTFFSCPAVHRSRLGMTLSREEPAAGEKPAPLLVTAIAPGSPAAKAGLLPGDAVTAAGGHEATALSVLHTAAMEAIAAGKPLTLTVSRAGETIDIAIPLKMPAAAKK